MAWALQYDGVNDYLSTNGTVTIASGATFEIEWRGTVPGNFARAFGDSGGNNSRLLIFNTSQDVYLTNSAGTTAAFTAPTYTKTDYNTFKFVRDASDNVSFYLNNVLIQTLTLAGSISFNQIGRNGSGTNVSVGAIEFLRIEIAAVGNVRWWDATASTHTTGQPVLKDISGYVTATDATGVNFPTDGSAWLDLGGGGSTLVADSGGYTYTGTAATLTVPASATLAADTGSYSYTGGDVALLKSSVLSTDSGSYTHNGSNIDLLKGLILNVDTSNYVYTGTSAALTYTPAGTNLLAADTGNYGYSGGDISFSRNRVIITSSGNYTYIGSGVSIILPGQIWTDRPAVNTTYTNKPAATTNWTDK